MSNGLGLQAMRGGATEPWSVNQHRQDIQPGDRIWFRVTGLDAGVYAAGRVTSVPRPEATDFGDWQVDVTFESRLDPPLLRAESDADLALSVRLPPLAGHFDHAPVYRSGS